MNINVGCLKIHFQPEEVRSPVESSVELSVDYCSPFLPLCSSPSSLGCIKRRSKDPSDMVVCLYFLLNNCAQRDK